MSEVRNNSRGDVHAEQPVYHSGTALESAQAALIMIHGRGASAYDILTLAPHVAHDGMAFLAPEAAGNTWYPNSFLMPRAQNEPYLSSALAKIDAIVGELERRGFSAKQIALCGFSQGACLASEYVATHPRRYGGLIVFSGGLIGPLDAPLEYSGDLAQTPVFVGCSDVDPHIPLRRVEETAEILEKMGARVTKRIYPGMEHTVNEEELTLARELLAELVHPV